MKQEKKKKIKTLSCIKHSGYAWLTRPRYIYSKHVWLDGIDVDLKKNNYLTNECNPHVKMITLQGNVKFFVNGDESKDIDYNRGLQIQRLRLFNQRVSNSFDANSLDVCNKQHVIDALGLDENLENLIIKCSYSSQ